VRQDASAVDLGRTSVGSLRAIIAHWGYVAIFAFVMLGNLGVPIPENSVLWIAGYFVWKGRLSLPLVLLVGIVAAVAGDNLGYWIGRRYGQPAVDRHRATIGLTPTRLDRMRRFVHRYGAVGVFLARFVIGLRFMAGPVAGSMGFPPLAFLLANVLGALVYVPVTIGEGYAVGYGYRRYVRRVVLGADTLEHLLLLGAIGLGLLFLAYHAVKYRRRREG